jgi:hypothetical protein
LVPKSATAQPISTGAWLLLADCAGINGPESMLFPIFVSGINIEHDPRLGTTAP